MITTTQKPIHKNWKVTTTVEQPRTVLAYHRGAIVKAALHGDILVYPWQVTRTVFDEFVCDSFVVSSKK